MVNRKKCSFGQDKIEYLGHVVSKDGVKADPCKVSDMKNHRETLEDFLV